MRLPRLFNPFLLRRLLKLQERQTIALETLANYVSTELSRTSRTLAEYPEDEDDILYTTDESTFYRERDERSRLRHTLASDEESD